MRRMDGRVTAVLNGIRGAEELRISLQDAAAMAFLSPSRFAHLFTQQMGLPFRRYVFWRKMTRAMLAIGGDGTIADAAHAADFLGCGASDPNVLSDVRHGAVGLDARPLRRDLLPVQRS